jgi:hypothetical protein
MAAGTRRLHSDELHNLFTLSFNTARVFKPSKRMQVEERKHVAAVDEMRNVLKTVICKPLWLRPIERSKDRRKDNIKTDLKQNIF